jgi:transcriptional regulator with XRE-family HTH domain
MLEKNDYLLIYNKIDKIRQTFGITKKDFCDFLGIKYDTYRKYKVGDRLISTEVLLKISKSFNISIDYILDSNFSPDEIEIGLWLKQASNTIDKNSRDDFLNTIKRYTLVQRLNYSSPHSEKTFWEKILYNPNEETIRALSLVLQSIDKENITLENAKQTLINAVNDYYNNLSIGEKIFTTIFTSEKKYLLEYIYTLFDNDCKIIIENSDFIVNDLKSNLKAPYSKILFKLKELGYKIKT